MVVSDLESAPNRNQQLMGRRLHPQTCWCKRFEATWTIVNNWNPAPIHTVGDLLQPIDKVWHGWSTINSATDYG